MTEYSRKNGWQVVGEDGPELIKIPKGTRIFRPSKPEDEE